MLYRYLNILFYSFILQKGCVCASVCVRKEVIEWVLGRAGVSVKLLWRTSRGVTDFWKHQEPFLLPLLSSTFQPIKAKITSEVMVGLPLTCVKTFRLHLWFPRKHWNVKETSSSQCLLGKNNKKEAVVSEGHEGMANRGDYTVGQSVRVRRKQPAACLTWADNATTHQITLPADGAVTTVYQREKSCWRVASSKAFLETSN